MDKIEEQKKLIENESIMNKICYVLIALAFSIYFMALLKINNMGINLIVVSVLWSFLYYVVMGMKIALFKQAISYSQWKRKKGML